ncbi:MAG: phosphate signaling complex protein PhoU [Acidimicrobiales bacterium]
MDIRRSFHHDLDLVRNEVVRLAGMVTEALAQATQAMLDGDLEVAESIIRNDDIIDVLTLDIEERCYQLLALQQPMAVDLRTLLTDLRMAAEIERSGDLVVNLMKSTRRLYGVDLDPVIRGMIDQLGRKVGRLFRLAIDAYVDGDAALASALDDMDDDIDELHADYIQAIFEAHERRHSEVQVSVQLALVGRYYERIADHAVNIGERVQYMLTGWVPEHVGAARLAAREKLDAERLESPSLLVDEMDPDDLGGTA